MSARLRKQIAIGIGSIIAVGGTYSVVSSSVAKAKEGSKDEQRKRDLQAYVPSRKEIMAKLKSNYTYDMLVIGGGATGSGIALDATTRGLSVALVEREDFAAATSSRSTKLIHGGVRYLEAAFKKLDPRQLSLVFDALHERALFLDNAPHLTRKLPIMTPCYAWWEVPYYWIGLKMYDLLSLNKRLASSRFVSRKESLLQFPMLAERDLKGSVVYYDGQMDDSRMNVGLAVTAAVHGASAANHVEVLELLKKEEADGKEVVCGAKVLDRMSGETFDIHARVIVNATGPYVDRIREMDNPTAKKLLSHSRGIHVILPDYYSPTEMGLIIPKTVDGRVIFVLPWLGKTVAGTTDTKTSLDASPKTDESEIKYVLDSISQYVRVKVRRDDVSAAWSGIRPLVQDPNATNTAAIVRDHFIEVRPSNLVTITGGKWTTYRTMAKELVDKAIEVGNLHPSKECVTQNVRLIGAAGWDKALFLSIAQNYYRMKQPNHGKYSRAPFNTDIAEHLSHSYGTRAFLVAELAQQGFGKRLAHNQPYIEAEVVYATRYEYACTAVDLIARRLRLAFLDSAAAHQALPRTISIMAQELCWDAERQQQELTAAMEFLDTMN